MFSRPLIIFAALFWTISIFFLFKCRAVAQLHSTKKGNKPFCVLPTALPVSPPRRTFAFHSSSRLLTWVRLRLGLMNACKFGQGHMERLREIQDLPGLCRNSIFALAHQDLKPDPVENNKTLHGLQQGALERALIIVFSAGFITNSINFNSKYLMFESFFYTRGKVSGKKKKEGRRLHFLFNFLPFPLLQTQS